MSYSYPDHKSWVCSEKGQKTFLTIRDHVSDLLEVAGAVSMHHAIKTSSGDVWEQMACVDRLVELGELREVSEDGCAGQHRLFVEGSTS